MTKQVLLRMSDEQHQEAKRLTKESGITLSELFVNRTLEAQVPSAYDSLRRETRVLKNALVLAGLSDFVRVARTLREDAVRESAVENQLAASAPRSSARRRLVDRRPQMAKMFEYAVILNEKCDKEGEVVEEAQVVVPVTAIVARDEGQAQMLAARAIPEEMVSNGKFNRLMVVVRPF